MFGCDSCYDTFAEELKALLPRMQGAERHEGTMPEAFRKDREASEKDQALQSRLDLAVAGERYEDAAQLRDEIKAIKDARHG